MKKKRQIEEIKQVLIKTCKRYRLFGEYYMQSKYAEALYNKGYRKQSDTAREILRMIKDKGLFRYEGYLLHDSDFDTVGKLYGMEVEK